ncbi:hypothetical protein AVEN_89134-1 [Araneus ventricosus]|uniref:Uncharacterized protein n=1 Tax=Araneus ventricosus TaxID=182803 RepID=A0A4Y2B1Y0_ARAVE|nr:hypothetical protein AVEN_89134-1 [Araneus ventricosus]
MSAVSTCILQEEHASRFRRVSPLLFVLSGVVSRWPYQIHPFGSGLDGLFALPSLSCWLRAAGSRNGRSKAVSVYCALTLSALSPWCARISIKLINW